MDSKSIFLIASDETDRDFIQLVLETVLDIGNLEVQTAASGEEALSLLLDQTPDLIILRTNTSDTDPVTLIREIRSIDRLAQIPMIVLFEIPSPMEEIYRAAGYYYVEHLKVPFTLIDLSSRVKWFLKHGGRPERHNTD